MPKLIRITTVPLALRTLLAGQMKYMKNKGWDVIMVSADGKERQAVVEYEGSEHHIVPMTRNITPFKDIVSLWRLYRFFKKQKPDIVHSHTPKAGLLGMIAAKMAGIPVRIHTIAGLRFITTHGIKRKILIRMEKLTCQMAQHVWVNSFSLKNIVESYNLSSVQKLKVIGRGSTNGIDLERFNSASLNPSIQSQVMEKMKFQDGLFYFLFVGRMVKDKGITELVDAFTRIHQSYPLTRLVLVGSLEQDLDPVAEKTLEIIKTNPAIIHVGWDSRTEYFFSLAHLFVFPSHREGFPNVLLQAGAMGCPVLCSAIPGNIDIITDGQTGLLFPVRDINVLFDKMQEAYLNRELLTEYAQSLKERVCKDFSQIFVHQKIEEAYQQYLAESISK